MLFAFTLAPKDVVLVILAVIAVVAVIGLLFRKDTAIEIRRRQMVELSGELKNLGLERLAGFAEAYAVGDYSGLYQEAKALLKEISDHDSALGLLRKSFFKQLPERLKRKEDSAEILEVVAQIQAANKSAASKTMSGK